MGRHDLHVMTELTRDTLFLALTRPPMKWGVPYEGFVCNVVISFIAGLWLGSPLYWLICVVIHLPMRALTSMDHNFFRVRRLQMQTKGAAVATDAWGGSSLAPLPIWPARSASEVRGGV
jgi:type IV secretion system protein VirB3